MARVHTKLVVVVLAAFGLAVPRASAGPADQPPASQDDRLQQYTVRGTPAQIDRLAGSGQEIVARRPGAAGRRAVDLVLTGRQRAALERRGLSLDLTRNLQGETALQAAAHQAEGGYRVWRRFAGPGGVEEELRRIARQHPEIVELVELGRSVQGQPILGLRVTRRDPGLAGPAVADRPAVLFCSLQHAREWISVEVNRRLLHHFVDRYGTDPVVTHLVDTRQFWFVVVANPDGYDHTFTQGNRLWRKNLRDNDGNSRITAADGVDLNRNFATRWGYDEEGSSSSRFDGTYRGPAPSSEPETAALDGLLAQVRFAFLVNYHSFGRLLLYPSGWQVHTETADQPIYEALSGDHARPAIEGYAPDLASGLYITNGETTDHAHFRYGTLAWTVELAEGCKDCGFVFPDDEGLVQAEFKRNLPFALDVAGSAGQPAEPVSHLGTTAPDFKVDTFPLSHGDPQPVQVDAKRRLGPVTMSFQVNDGEPVVVPTAEWDGGERYGADGDAYYHRLRGMVTGAHPGDRVKVHFEAAGERSESFSYRVASDTGHPVLILAAEDYTDPDASGARRPRYLTSYADALQANGLPADVYDVDAEDRRAPDPLGVLGHYQAVVWYTGDDRIIRDGHQNEKYGVAKLALDEVLAARDYLNEGGSLLYTGKHAGLSLAGDLFYGTKDHPEEPCRSDQPEEDCLPLGDDFPQYWLGAGLRLPLGGLDPEGRPGTVAGLGRRLGDLRFGLAGGDGAGNQKQGTAALLATSRLLSRERYPQFESQVEALYDTGRPAPFGPFTGRWFAASQAADVSYKRLSRRVDLSGARTGELSFRTSYDMDEGWDFLFVEAHTVGQDDWTTLPDGKGHTSDDTGASCAEGWATLHPFLAHYQTPVEDKPCTAEGSTGTWHAATGRSDGWEEWRVDLSPWAGRQVEVSITYASDGGYQGVGVFVDDTVVTTGDRSATTSFEDGLGGWSVPGPPEGTLVNENDWARSDASFEPGAAVSTPSTLYFGFGFEAIPTTAERTAVMGRAMAFLLGHGV